MKISIDFLGIVAVGILAKDVAVVPAWLTVPAGICMILWSVSRLVPDVWATLQAVAVSWLDRLRYRPPPT